MKKVVLITVGVLSLGILSFSLTGCFGGGYGEHRYNGAGHFGFGEHRTNRIVEDLDLTKTQQAKFNALADKMKANFKANHQAADNQELANLLDDDKLDQTKFKQLLNQKSTKQQKITKELVPEIADFVDSLDKTQKSKLKEKILSFKDKGRHHW